MARFAYIADTHLGADLMGYQMQEGHPERLPEILDALQGFIDETGGVDFVLHGGDMVDAGVEAHIRRAVEVFRLSVPVYLCLGNHDVTDERSLEMWLELAPGFFPGGRPEFTVRAGGCAVHVVPNHWEEDRPYFWGSRQDPRFRADQVAWLTGAVAASRSDVTFVATHSPALGLPPEQTGFDEPHHAPPPTFHAALAQQARGNDHLVCVLGAHNHMNMRVQSGGVEYVTVSSLSEVPFECKLFDVGTDALTMSTHSLGERLSFGGRYDFERTWVQGRPVDRGFERALG